MKHSDLWNKYRELDAIEREELKKAVMAHGGEFRFMTCEGEPIKGIDVPIVAACVDGGGTGDYGISRVAVANNELEFYGIESHYGSKEEVLSYIELAHISYITDNIPETNKVKDVTTPTLIKSLDTLYCSECGSNKVQNLVWADSTTGELISLADNPCEPDNCWCNSCEKHTQLLSLLELWHKLEDIPVDADECIEEPFMKFPIGTDKFEIWHWFDERCPHNLHDDLLY